MIFTSEGFVSTGVFKMLIQTHVQIISDTDIQSCFIRVRQYINVKIIVAHYVNIKWNYTVCCPFGKDFSKLRLFEMTKGVYILISTPP